MIVQYGLFLKQIVTLDFGDSITYARPVLELIQPKIMVTVGLVISTTIFVLLLSFPLGYLAGSKHGTPLDSGIKTGALIVISLPQFWVGTLFLLLFGLKLHWFPVGGWGDTFLEHAHFWS